MFFETAGWERPHLVRVQRRPARRSTATRDAARARVGRALVVADHQRRAPARCASARASSTCRRSRSSTSSGPRALDAVQRIVVAQCDVAVGRGRLHAGPRRARAASAPTSPSCAWPTTTSGSSPAARTAWPTSKWFADRMPDDGRRSVVDHTSTLDDHRALGPAGARHPRRRSPRDDVSQRGLRVRHLPRRSRSAALPVLASRISYVGELGWELYVPMEQGAALWDALLEAGDAARRWSPVGIGVYGTTGRLEKGYRAYGAELDAERTHHRGRHAAAEGQGSRTSSARRPYLAQRARPRSRCCAR